MSKPTLRKKPTSKILNNSVNLKEELYLTNSQENFKRSTSSKNFQPSSKKSSFLSKK